MPVLFPFAPNWSSAFTIEHSFKTEILLSRELREQRIANRQMPRRSVSFTAGLMRGRLADFHAFMAKNQQGEFWLPDWTRRVVLNAAVAPGGDTLLVDQVPGWVLEGQFLLVVSGDAQYLIEIAALAVGQIILGAPLPLGLPQETKIYLTYEAVIDQRIQNKLLTNTVGEPQLVFSVRPGTFAEDDGTAPYTFNGRELVLEKPNWAQAPDVELEGFRETVDFGVGVTDEYALTVFNRRYLQATFSGRAAQIEANLSFFRRMKGQRGEFYMPTWEPDLDLSIGAAVAATTLAIPGSNFFDRYGGSPVYKAVIFFFRDGAWEAKRITNVAYSGGNSVLTFNSALSRAVNETTTRMGCLLPVWRFATDDVTVEWLTDSVGQIQTTFTTVEDL